MRTNLALKSHCLFHMETFAMCPSPSQVGGSGWMFIRLGVGEEVG